MLFAEPIKLSPVVITAPKIKDIPQKLRVITQEEIETRQESNVIELLRSEAGIHVVRTGSLQQNSSVFIQGADPEHTLILVDGIDASDPSGPSGSFPFEFLTVDNIERIEIIKGPQSTLYGSKAIGGVINIITKKGKGASKNTIKLAAGTQDTYRFLHGLHGSTEKFSYSYTFSHQQAAGWGNARVRGNDDRGKYKNPESDGYESQTLTGNFSYAPSEELEAELLIRVIDNIFDADNHPGREGDDLNREERYKAMMFQLNLKGYFLERSLNHKLSLGGNRHNRRNNNPPDPDHPEESEFSEFEGSINKLEWQTEWKGKHHQVIMGYEHVTEQADNQETINGQPGFLNLSEEAARIGRYVDNRLLYENDTIKTKVSFGGRLETHDRFGKETTRSAALSLQHKPTFSTIRFSQGTGFRVPTLFGLFSMVGDPDLQPEKSVGKQFNFEQYFDHENLSVLINATWFHNKVNEMISFVPQKMKLENLDESLMEGHELSLEIMLGDHWTFRYSNTIQRAVEIQDGSKDLPMLNRPDHKFAVDVDYRTRSWNFHTDYQFVGERHDQDQYSLPSQRVVLPPYKIANVTSKYQYNQQTRYTFSMKNVFNEDYEDLLGFGTPPRQIHLGIELHL
ncbi:MAG: TonB-dependent receptor [SAR324 cluster bacterium]|nr:TonB-dependent receptor [SAR324 cluster bacterium]